MAIDLLRDVFLEYVFFPDFSLSTAALLFGCFFPLPVFFFLLILVAVFFAFSLHVIFFVFLFLYLYAFLFSWLVCFVFFLLYLLFAFSACAFPCAEDHAKDVACYTRTVY